MAVKITSEGHIYEDGNFIIDLTNLTEENGDDLPVGSPGDSIVYNSTGTPISVPLVKEAYVVETQDEYNEVTATTPDTQDIFNNWNRFSHEGSQINVDPLTVSGGASVALNDIWEFDVNTSTITMGYDVSAHLGFASDVKSDRYVHEVTLSSDEDDTGGIGVVIAFDNDGSDEHTLTVVRTCGGAHNDNPHQSQQNHYAVWYNYGRDDQQLIADGSGLIPLAANNWSAYPSGTRVRVERNENNITIYTSPMNQSSVDSNSKLTINLNDDPQLSVFRGKKSFGYSCYSQAGSTFSNINYSIQESLDKVYDIRDKLNPVVWVSDGETWNQDTNINVYEDLGYGRVVVNTLAKKAWFVNSDDTLLKLQDAGFLGGSNNLADIEDVDLARQNLSVPSIAEFEGQIYKVDGGTQLPSSLQQQEMFILYGAGGIEGLYAGPEGGGTPEPLEFGVTLDDTTTSTDAVWSSEKTSNEIQNAVGGGGPQVFAANFEITMNGNYEELAGHTVFRDDFGITIDGNSISSMGISGSVYTIRIGDYDATNPTFAKDTTQVFTTNFNGGADMFEDPQVAEQKNRPFTANISNGGQVEIIGFSQDVPAAVSVKIEKYS